MKIVESRFLRGPNLFARRRVMLAVVDLEQLDELPSNDIDGFTDRLLQMLPGIRAHHCGVGYEGGFVDRLREGTYMGHIAEHLMLELQSLAGDDIRYGNTRMIPDRPRHYRIVVGYEVEAVALRALQIAIELVEAASVGRTLDVVPRVAELKRLRRRHGSDLATQALAEAARERRIPVIRPLDDANLLQLGWGARQRRLQSGLADPAPHLAVETARDLQRTREWLMRAGLAVPDSRLCGTLATARSAADQIGWPVDLRPRHGCDRQGVSIAVANPEALVDAFDRAREVDAQVLVDRHLPGQERRVLVVHGDVLAVLARAECAAGDDDTRRASAPARLAAPSGPTALLDGPAWIEAPALSGNGEVGRTCLRAARRIGLEVAIVDVVCEAQGTGHEGAPKVLRVAPAADAVDSLPGPVRARWARALLSALFQGDGAGADPEDETEAADAPTTEGATGRIPLVAVCGSSSALAARWVTAVLQDHGLRAAGSLSLSHESVRGSHAGALAVLTDPEVDAAVLSCDDEDLLQHGLAFDRSDVAVVLDLGSTQPAEPANAEAAKLKAVVVDTARRAAVLNAQDPACVNLRDELPDGAQLIWFSCDAELPLLREHAAGGGRAVVLREGRVVVLDGHRSLTLGELERLGAGSGSGADKSAEAAGVLAAVAALVGLGLSPLSVATALRFEVSRQAAAARGAAEVTIGGLGAPAASPRGGWSANDPAAADVPAEGTQDGHSAARRQRSA